MVLDYLHSHKNRPISLQAIADKTGLFVPDIALAFQLLNFVRCVKRDGDFKYQVLFSIDWKKVDAYHEKMIRAKNRIPIDAECLRWTPLLTPALHMLKSDSEEEDEVDTHCSRAANVNESTSPDLTLAEIIKKETETARKGNVTTILVAILSILI